MDTRTGGFILAHTQLTRSLPLEHPDSIQGPTGAWVPRPVTGHRKRQHFLVLMHPPHKKQTTRTHVHIYIYSYIYIYIYVYMKTNMSLSLSLSIYICIYIYMYICIHKGAPLHAAEQQNLPNLIQLWKHLGRLQFLCFWVPNAIECGSKLKS